MSTESQQLMMSMENATKALYNQGVIDGVSLILQMMEDENNNMTLELAIETCKEFIRSHTNGGSVQEEPNEPSIPEMPDDAESQGMTKDVWEMLQGVANNAVSEEVQNPDINMDVNEMHPTEIDTGLIQPDDISTEDIPSEE